MAHIFSLNGIFSPITGSNDSIPQIYFQRKSIFLSSLNILFPATENVCNWNWIYYS